MRQQNVRLNDEISVKVDLPNSQAFCMVTVQMRWMEIQEKRDKGLASDVMTRSRSYFLVFVL